MINFKVDWRSVDNQLYHMDGWQCVQDSTVPANEHGLGPIADNPKLWAWQPRIPECLREKEPEQQNEEPETQFGTYFFGAI